MNEPQQTNALNESVAAGFESAPATETLVFGECVVSRNYRGEGGRWLIRARGERAASAIDVDEVDAEEVTFAKTDLLELEDERGFGCAVVAIAKSARASRPRAEVNSHDQGLQIRFGLDRFYVASEYRDVGACQSLHLHVNGDMFAVAPR